MEQWFFHPHLFLTRRDNVVHVLPICAEFVLLRYDIGPFSESQANHEHLSAGLFATTLRSYRVRSEEDGIGRVYDREPCMMR